MKNLKTLLRLLCLGIPLLHGGSSGAQMVNVSQSTGAATINIPIYTISRGKIAVPISISYYGNGVRARDIEGAAGMGWQLSAGGSITRELRDVPDDLADNAKGWLYNNNASKISNFFIANDGSNGTCYDEAADLSYINSNFGDLSDTEPDVFNINVPGLSCKLIFDGSHQPRTIPYRDVKISYTTDYIGIEHFKIINDKGMTYEFNVSDLVNRKAFSTNASAIQFFKRKYDISQSVSFRKKWFLTSIKDNDGNAIIFNYGGYQNYYRVTRKNYDFYLGNTTTKTNQFYVEDGGFTKMLTGIDYITDDVITPGVSKFNFTYAYNSSTFMPLLQGISGLGRGWLLSYDEAFVQNGSYKRQFLKEFREISEESALRYRFEYNGLTTGNLNRVYTTLPDSSSKQLDRWGYYNASTATSLMPEVFINPATAGMERLRYEQVATLAPNYPYYISGNSRTVNSAALITGSLSKVSLLDGGTTEIEYEPNTYFDPQANNDANGSGIRVKKLTTYDASLPVVQKTVNYSYTDPTTGRTSGRAMSLPIYAFIRPYPVSSNPEADWKNSVVRSEEDLSEVDDGVMYGFFKESVAGQGYMTAEFSLPATHFDLTASPGWSRVITNVAGCNGVGGRLNNDRDLYPFVPNVDISFERGLPTREAVYNEAGQKLSETLYSFSRTGNAQYIPAFKRAYNDGVLTYAKYNVLTGVESAIQQKQDFMFDVASGQQQKQTVNYFYQGSGHLYPTKVETQNGDGKMLRVLTRYVKDYDLSLAKDSATLALKSMASKNINIPIETFNQVERGGVAKTVSASLTRFAIFNPGNEQAAKTLTFRNAAGVTDFQLSSIQSGNFVNDTRYYLTGNFTDYNTYGQLLSANDAKGRTNSAIYDDYSRLPLASIANARHDEVSYSSFEQGNLAGLWFEANGQSSPTSYTGKMSGITGPSAVLYKDLKKKPGSMFYILSAWVNCATANSLNFSVINSANQAVTNALNTSATSGEWKYYQVRVPVGAMGQNFRLRLWASASLLIDDVVFRPEEAGVQINSYDVLTENKLVTASANGMGVQYDYDGANRIKRVYDQDKNMVQKNTLILATNQDHFAPRIVMNENQLVNQPIGFNMENDAVTSVDGLTFTWNFGDGSPVVVTSTISNNTYHTYSAVGTYTVSLTKSSPDYGSVTVTKNLIISQPQLNGTQLIANWDMTLTFYQNNQVVSQFYPSDLSSGPISITPGLYKVRVGVFGAYSSSNPYGFRSILYSTLAPNSSTPLQDCIPSAPGVNVYEFYVDTTGKEKLSIWTSTEQCSIGSIE